MQPTPATLKSRAAAMLVALAFLLVAMPGHAQLRLDITQGVRDAVPIAVVPFGGQAEGGANDIAAVVANDLRIGIGDGAILIDILDPQNNRSAGGAGLKPCKQKGTGIPQVQISGRAWS